MLHAEAFVVPRDGHIPSVKVLEEARDGCSDLHWMIQDIVLVPVSELPQEAGGAPERQSERNL